MPSPASDSGTATMPSGTRAITRPRSPSQSFASYRDSGLGIFALLLAFRIVNALTLRTFFQPDEFFQSLEPAWQLAFGHASNAWITWEWRTQLRSSLHPGIFAGVYLVAAKLSDLGILSLPSKAELFIAAPKVTQAVFAALLDLYTWRLAQKVHGRASHTVWITLALSLCSPWQWFCSTRTLSNCLETTITIIAVYYWPWQWPASAERESQYRGQDHEQIAAQDVRGTLPQLRVSLLLAAFACILRPTNALVWLAVSLPTLWFASSRQRYLLVREILFCGSAVVACSVLSDRIYYQVWTLPPLRFLYFNIAQSLAVFYGRNRPDYYLTEGLPLLLTTALPFALVGVWQALRLHPAQTSGSVVEGKFIDSAPGPPPQDDVVQHPLSSYRHDVVAPRILPRLTAASASPGEDGIIAHRILSRLAWTSIVMILVLSLISHKEVRFLYPILPFLHILAAEPISSFFLSPQQCRTSSEQTNSPISPHNPSSRFQPTKLTPSILRLHPSIIRRTLLISFLAINIAIAGYASQVHQRGVIDVLTYLRHKHEGRITSDGKISAPTSNITTTVGFLMPCHSTPWRSHFVHPDIQAWALTCEPPLDVPLSERDKYLDEADQFYISPGPIKWLGQNMETTDTIVALERGSRSGGYWVNQESKHKQVGRRSWPENIVFFEALEREVVTSLKGTKYKECWRGFNSHFHDDSRRVGDVIVWCLD